MGFTKLDERILQSSIMAESAITFKVWIALLAACRESGIAYVSSVYLSSICHLPLSRVEDSLKKLEGPDEHSRSLADDGRRIRRVDGGYEIINYTVYRDFSLRDAEAERKRLYRQRLRECPDNVPCRPDSSASVSASSSASLIIEILKYLNDKTGKKFSPKSADTIKHISARIAEGWAIDDFKHVIDVKVAKWKGKTWKDARPGREGETVNGDDLLRPSTLFRAGNFENYVNEAATPAKVKKTLRVLQRDGSYEEVEVEE
jgi:uncharacterized phage protein (TIGR02220 family)